MSNCYYEVVIDYYGGPSIKTCRTKREIKPLIKRMESIVSGGMGPVYIYKITHEDISKEFRSKSKKTKL